MAKVQLNQRLGVYSVNIPMSVVRKMKLNKGNNVEFSDISDEGFVAFAIEKVEKW